MALAPFTGSFTQQEPIGEDAIAAAVAVMRSGRLHRYNVAAGEKAQAAKLEREFAAWQGAAYCLACASGGCDAVDRLPRSGGVGSEHHAAARMATPSMPARASAGVR